MRFDAGSPWWLDSTGLATEAAEAKATRFEGDPWEEVIACWIEGRLIPSVSEVLSSCLDKLKSQWTQADKPG